MHMDDNLPEIGKTLFVTLMKRLESRAIKKYLGKAPERYVRNEHESHQRILRISFGKVHYHFAQLVDISSNKSFSHLRKMLSIDPYKHYQRERLKAPINPAIHMSYQKATVTGFKENPLPLYHGRRHKSHANELS